MNESSESDTTLADRAFAFVGVLVALVGTPVVAVYGSKHSGFGIPLAFITFFFGVFIVREATEGGI